MNEVTGAKLCLLEPTRKAQYDAALFAHLTVTPPVPPPVIGDHVKTPDRNGPCLSAALDKDNQDAGARPAAVAARVVGLSSDAILPRLTSPGLRSATPAAQRRTLRSGRLEKPRQLLKVLNVILAIIVPGSAALGIVWFLSTQTRVPQALEPTLPKTVQHLPPRPDSSVPADSIRHQVGNRLNPDKDAGTGAQAVGGAIPKPTPQRGLLRPGSSPDPSILLAQVQELPKNGAEPSAPPAALPQAAPPKAADNRLAVPADAAEKSAAKLIRDVYGADYDKAKTADQRVALAKKLISDGIDTQDDPVGRYSLFRIARDIATDAGEIETSAQAVDEMGKRYAIDTLQAQVDLLLKIGKSSKSPGDQRELIRRSKGSCQRCNYARPLRTCNEMLRVRGGGWRDCANDPLLLKQAEGRAKRIAAMQAAFEKAKGADCDFGG